MLNKPAGAKSYEEASLIDVINGLWLQKWLILAFVVVFALLGGSYAFLSKPIYEAKVFVIPPAQKDIANFNYGRTKDSELEPFSVKSVYDVFLRNLQAESLRRYFFENFYLPSLSEEERKGSLEGVYDRFSNVLSIALADKSSPDRYAVAIQGSNPAQIVEWVKAFVEQAKVVAVGEMIDGVKREAEVRARNLEQQINAQRENGEKVREDHITRLNEALRIAEAIGLEKPPIIRGDLSSEVSANMNGELTYIRGSKALQAEINNLKERKLNDPFIVKLRDLQLKYAFYKELAVSPDDVAVFRQDGPIETPDKPVKPKKILILAVAILLGGVVGVFVAIFRTLVRHNREVYPS